MGTDMSCVQAVALWLAEEPNYQGGFSEASGHYSQVRAAWSAGGRQQGTAWSESVLLILAWPEYFGISPESRCLSARSPGGVER